MTGYPHTRTIVTLTLVAAVAGWIGQGLAQGIPRGTSEIGGRVVASNAPTPIARAFVTVTGQALPKGLTVITDEDGHFVFRDLPAGSFTITAARPSYVTSSYGAKRPGRPGTPVSVGTGQRVADLAIELARGAAITGMIRDQNGDPMPNLDVVTTPLAAQPGSPVASVMTDDRGIYRVFGLAPGQYLVMARLSGITSPNVGQVSDAEIDDLLQKLQQRASAGRGGAIASAEPVAARGRGEAGPRFPTYGYAPFYYQGTPDPDQAVAVVLAEGEERQGVDIVLRLIRNVTVEGRVSFEDGTVPPNTQITLTRTGTRARSGDVLVTPGSMRRADASGGFQFTGVAPGKYRVIARATTTAAFWAVADMTLGDADISGLAMTLRPGMRLSGRVIFDAHTLRPPDTTAVRLRVVDVASPGGPVASAAGRADGTFEINGILPGVYSMASVWADTGWWLRSVEIGGKDLLDFPVELNAGDVTGAVVTFSDRHTELTGTLQTASNLPAPEHFIIVFPSDRSLWGRASRRLQSTRPSTAGQYSLRDLPPGDYFIAALTDLEPGDLMDTAFLEQILPAAVTVRLGEGERKVQDLRLAKGR